MLDVIFHLSMRYIANAQLKISTSIQIQILYSFMKAVQFCRHPVHINTLNK